MEDVRGTAELERCVEEAVTTGKGEAEALTTCTAVSQRKGKPVFEAASGEPSGFAAESFEFDFSVREARRVWGHAIHPLKTYHPNEWPELRVYLREELKKAAESLVGKPFGVDHLYLLPPPNRIYRAYWDEEKDAVYFEGLVDEEVAERILHGEFKGVSIELNWERPGGKLEYVDGVAPRNFEFTSLHFLKRFPPGDPKAFVRLWEAVLRRKRLPEGDSASPTPPKGLDEPSRVVGEEGMSFEERVWTRAYINDLPDAAFAVVLPGGKKDETGKTVPRSLRKFPHHRSDGTIDIPHLRNANARVSQSKIPDEYKRKAKEHLDRHKKALKIGEFAEAEAEPFRHEWPVKEVVKETDGKGEREVEELEEVEFEAAGSEVPEWFYGYLESIEEKFDQLSEMVEHSEEGLASLERRVRALEKSQRKLLNDETQRGSKTEGTSETSETVKLRAEVAAMKTRLNEAVQRADRAKVKFEALKTMIEAAITRNRNRARQWGWGPQAFINDLKSILKSTTWEE